MSKDHRRKYSAYIHTHTITPTKETSLLHRFIFIVGQIRKPSKPPQSGEIGPACLRNGSVSRKEVPLGKNFPPLVSCADTEG